MHDECDFDKRDGLREYLKEQGIPTMIYYPKPMHRQEAFAGQEFDEKDFAVSNRLCKTVLELPMHPYMEDEEIEFVAGRILRFLRKYRQ